MKKAIGLLAGLAWIFLVFLPQPGLGAEFTLGGNLVLHAVWDSTQTNNSYNQFILRNNDPNFQHGRLKFSSEKSRLYFLIKGPQVWGAKTSGYIEWDFCEGGSVSTAPGALGFSPQKSRPALRHAMFRLNWPSTELLMGQYWGLLSEEFPEIATPQPLGKFGGIPTYREPQIRLSQKFCNGFEAAVALSEPMNGAHGIFLVPDQVANGNIYTGESSETPRVTGRLKYEQDLWGKGASFGVLRPFTARLGASWQRSRFRAVDADGRIFGQNNYANIRVRQPDQQYLNPWIVEGSIFAPLIPTYSPNLAGTLSLLTQWYVGAGVDFVAEDLPQNTSYLNSQYLDGKTLVGDRVLMQKYGGLVQLQYYFTNQWFLNSAWTMQKAFGVDLDRWSGFRQYNPAADPVKFNQHYYLTLWFRPIQALKFGVEYAYIRTDYFQRTAPLAGQHTSDFGEDHHIMFVSFFFF